MLTLLGSCSGAPSAQPEPSTLAPAPHTGGKNASKSDSDADHGDGSTITIISHHKTGTFAGFMTTSACCCDDFNNEFWGAWKKRCEADCHSKDIQLCNDGLHGGKDCLESPSMKGRSVVNFVRHPIDVTVSGYLYHRECNEGASETPYDGWFLNKDHGAIAEVRRVLGALPDPAKDPRPYCLLLQQNNASIGVYAELVRSLGSGNGVATMLEDYGQLESLKDDGETQVHQVCLSTVTPGIEGGTDHFWELTDSLGCNKLDEDTLMNSKAQHGTSTTDVPELDATRNELRDYAKVAISAVMPEALKELAEQMGDACPVETSETLQQSIGVGGDGGVVSAPGGGGKKSDLLERAFDLCA